MCFLTLLCVVVLIEDFLAVNEKVGYKLRGLSQRCALTPWKLDIDFGPIRCAHRQFHDLF